MRFELNIFQFALWMLKKLFREYLEFSKGSSQASKSYQRKKREGGEGRGERENGKRGRPGEPRAACEKEIMRVSLSFEHKFGQNKKKQIQAPDDLKYL
jgi:hypothetical protein